jgi:hypothetical protein
MSVAISGPALLLLGASWLVLTLGLGFAVAGLERAIYPDGDRFVGWEFWCIVAGGGGAAGGLVALTAIAQANAIEPMHHAIVAAFSLINVTLVATIRWVMYA